MSDDLNKDFLTESGIEIETSAPDDIMTPGKAKSVKFRISKPQGYFTEDVESFVFENLVPSLTWYADTLHKRDLDVHTLATKLDEQEELIKELRRQATLNEYQSSIAEGENLAQQDSEISTLIQRTKDYEAEIVSLKSEIESLNSKVVEPVVEATVENHESCDATIAKLNAEIAELKSVTAVTEPAVVSENHESCDAKIAQLQADLAERIEYAKQLDEYVDAIQPFLPQESEEAESEASAEIEVDLEEAEEPSVAEETIPVEVEAEESIIIEYDEPEVKAPASPSEALRAALLAEEMEEETPASKKASQLPPGLNPEDI